MRCAGGFFQGRPLTFLPRGAAAGLAVAAAAGALADPPPAPPAADASLVSFPPPSPINHTTGPTGAVRARAHACQHGSRGGGGQALLLTSVVGVRWREWNARLRVGVGVPYRPYGRPSPLACLGGAPCLTTRHGGSRLCEMVSCARLDAAQLLSEEPVRAAHVHRRDRRASSIHIIIRGDSRQY